MALEDSYTGSGVIPINTVLLDTVDADGMRGLAMQIKSIGTSGSCVVQTSMDGASWVNVQMQNVLGGASVTGLTTAGMFWCNLVGRYFRVVLTTATTAGTTSVLTRLSKDEFSEMGNGVSAAVTSLPALSAGGNTVGCVIAQISPVSGPALLYHKLTSCLGTTNATSVKTSSGRVVRIIASGMTTGRYLKLYNKASAPTVGTDVPVLTFWIRANTDVDINMSDIGLSFSTGIAYAITGGPNDSDTAAATAGDVVGLNIVYI